MTAADALLKDLSMRVIVEWPNGGRLPVRISLNTTGQELVELLKFSLAPDSICVLIYRGAYVDPKCALAVQVRQNDVISIRPAPSELLDYSEYTDSEDAEVDESGRVYDEALRLADVQFNMIDANRRGGVVMTSYLTERSDSDDSCEEKTETVFGEKVTEIPCDPLPTIPLDDDKLQLQRVRLVRAWRW